LVQLLSALLLPHREGWEGGGRSHTKAKLHGPNTLEVTGLSRRKTVYIFFDYYIIRYIHYFSQVLGSVRSMFLKTIKTFIQ